MNTARKSFSNITSKFWLLTASLVIVGMPMNASAQATAPEYEYALEEVKIKMANGVDIRTGGFHYHNNDLSIGSGDTALTLTRMHNSDQRNDPIAPFGKNTTHSLNVYLAKMQGFFPGTVPFTEVTSPHAVVVGGQMFMFEYDGTQNTFQSAGGGPAVSMERYTSVNSNTGQTHTIYEFTNIESGYKVIFDDTTWGWNCTTNNYKFTYNRCVAASHIEYANGEHLVYLNAKPTTSGLDRVRIASVTNSRGYSVRFSYVDDTTGAYNEDKFLIDRVTGEHNYCKPGSVVYCTTGEFPSADYTYHANDTLATYRNGESEGFDYGYNTNKQMEWMTRTDHGATRVFENTYGFGGWIEDIASSPVLEQRDDRGKLWTFDYTLENDCTEGGAGACWEALTETRVTDPMQGVTQFIFGLDHIEPVSSIPIYELMPTTVGLPGGGTFNYEYSFRHRLFSKTFPSGIKETYTRSYGKISEIDREAAPGSGLPNQVTKYNFLVGCTNWRICSRPISYEDPEGNVTDFAYDPNHGGLTAVLLPANSNGDRALTTFIYQPFRAPAATQSGSALYPWLTQTDVYKLTEQTRCLAPATSTSDTCPAASSLTIENLYTHSSSGTTSSFELRGFTVDPSGLGITTTFSYDKVGNQLFVDGPLASADVTRYLYDSTRRLTGTIFPQPDALSNPPVTLLGYDTFGNVTIREEGSTSNGAVSGYVPSRSICTDYDAGGRKTATRGPGASTTSGACPDTSNNYTSHSTTTYDDKGRVDIEHRYMSTGQGPTRSTKTTYDHNDRILKIIRAFGTSLQQDYRTATYTLDGQLDTLADANGNLTDYDYDGQGRLDRTTFPDLTYETYQYDANNNLEVKRTRIGQLIVNTYDANNQLKTKTVPGGDAADPTLYTFEYDLAGRKVWDEYWGYRQNYDYDDADRLVERTHENGLMAVGYDYDPAGNIEKLTYPDGWEAEFDYDTLGRAVEAREGSAAANEQPNRILATIGYDEHSRRGSINYYNGTSAGYSYQARGDFDTHDLIFNASSINYDFDSNKVGQLTNKTVSDSALFWSPDGASTTNYQINNLNQCTGADLSSFDYDDNGNLTDADNGRTYQYDAANALVRATQGGSEIAHYIHYADGNRRYKTAGGQVSRFYYAGNQEILETGNGNTDIEKRYVRIPGSIDEPVLMLNYSASASNPTEEWAHLDRNGSVVAVSDENGDIIEKFAYSPYGLSSTLGASMPFRYTGQKFDPETGLYYYKARYYDPNLGRFLQTDPIGYEDQMNMYAYVGNDPLNSVDPTGKFVWHAVGAIVGGGLNIAAQLVANGGDFGAINRTEVAVAAVAGAVGVYAAGAIATTVSTELALTGAAAVAANVAGNTVAGSAIGAVTPIANGVLDTLDGTGTDLSVNDIVAGGQVGAVTGATGALFGESFGAVTKAAGNRLLGEPGTLNGLGRALTNGGSDLFSNSGDLVIETKDVILDENL